MLVEVNGNKRRLFGNGGLMHQVNEIALRVMKTGHPQLVIGCSMDHVRFTQELHTVGGKMPEREVHVVHAVIQQRV